MISPILCNTATSAWLLMYSHTSYASTFDAQLWTEAHHLDEAEACLHITAMGLPTIQLIFWLTDVHLHWDNM